MKLRDDGALDLQRRAASPCMKPHETCEAKEAYLRCLMERAMNVVDSARNSDGTLCRTVNAIYLQMLADILPGGAEVESWSDGA